MSLLPAKCPCCGADLELPDNTEKAYCVYCGSNIIVQAAVQFAKVQIVGKVEVEGVASANSLLKRAKGYEDALDFDAALEYYNRILDIDPENTEATQAASRINEYNRFLLDSLDELATLINQQRFDQVLRALDILVEATGWKRKKAFGLIQAVRPNKSIMNVKKQIVELFDDMKCE